MKLWLAVVVLGCAGCSKPSPPSKGFRALPQLQLEQFPPGLREEIGKMYEAARANPRDPTAVGELGMMLHAHEQYRAAELCYRRAETLDPKSFAWPYYLALVLGQQADYAGAIDALQRSLRLDPHYVPAQRRMAELLPELGRTGESEQWYRRLTSEHQDSAEAWYGLGRAQSARGELTAAVAALRRACELFPRYGAAHYALALALRKQNQQVEAQQHLTLFEQFKLERPASNDPVLTEVLGLNRTAANYLRQAANLESEGKLEEAVEATRRAIESDANSEQAHINLISLYGRLAQFEKAEEHYHKAVALNPSRSECHYNYGVLKFSQKRFQEAKAAFARALAIDPNYAEAHNNLGYILEEEGHLREAANHYRKAIENQPGYRLAHFHLGRLLLNLRRYSEAIAHFQKTITPEDESTPGYCYALGVAYGRSGDHAQAFEWMSRARQQALARGQTQLAASIDQDLGRLERAGTK